MGLRKIIQDERVSYLYSTATPEELGVVVLHRDSAHSLKLIPESDAVQRWCRNLEKTPEEYLALVALAADNLSSVCEMNGKDMKEDIFEIQDGHLVWKQYFPEKKVYGRRGKFPLEKMEYDCALDEIMKSVMGDLADSVKTIDKLKLDLQSKTEEVGKATDLVAKSVKMKEDFEKEIYGKCAAIINTKKLRIRQIISKKPSVAANLSIRAGDSSEIDGSNTKADKVNSSDSECYNSDTDVDDPDQDDTDEENLRSLSPRKPKKYGDTQSKKIGSVKRVVDSQDDIFNNSIEAELYPSSLTDKRRKIGTSEVSRKGANASQLDCKNGKDSSSKSLEGNRFNESKSFQSDTQGSILDELF